ncbi:hypothetical protein PRIPAC_79552, partial [Pristionchus pacificus]|uniref:Serine/threonine-protein phosphatase n=1 Tax=Pristionchus pacificus TaxID=54126 RepID=A0A2A6CC39_PRIPA
VILSRCGDTLNSSYLFQITWIGVECFLLVLALRIRYPDRVFMLRGNHEDCNSGMIYGFYDECRAKFVFNWMPVSAIMSDKILCMYGGLSPYLNTLQQIENLPRPSIIPPYGLMCDILWSDRDNKYPGWPLSPRKISYCFDDTITKKFCADMGIDLIVRAHQFTKDFKGGYKFFADGRLLSIFSATNYNNEGYRGYVLRAPPAGT